ncbi:hypothetical protein TIFTF001_029363 [Ficus carica]|uniref:Uncharacterized protein n=1 Tax=Ficus carica TaxID=3494 RepID=A0AA88J1G1_FICCA|nr:hypothetical protein TIFTF001_029363 [Ficus carica]
MLIIPKIPISSKFLPCSAADAPLPCLPSDATPPPSCSPSTAAARFESPPPPGRVTPFTQTPMFWGCKSQPRWVRGPMCTSARCGQCECRRSCSFGDRGKALVSSSPKAVFDHARLPLLVVVSWETEVSSSFVYLPKGTNLF